MSLYRWMEDVYSVPAEECPKEQAGQHSLTKWIGLRPETLAQYEVEQNMNVLRDASGRTFNVDSSTCALCFHYLNNDESEWCASCPLYGVLGKSCDAPGDTPYLAWVDTGDPEPMIAALEAVVKRAAGSSATPGET